MNLGGEEHIKKFSLMSEKTKIDTFIVHTMKKFKKNMLFKISFAFLFSEI